MNRHAESTVYPDATSVTSEVRLWWARRNAPPPVVIDCEGTARPRWTRPYVVKVIRSDLSRLRYLRSLEAAGNRAAALAAEEGR